MPPAVVRGEMQDARGRSLDKGDRNGEPRGYRLKKYGVTRGDHFRCPGCRHKLRYRAQSVGHRGFCPRCRHQFIFPPAPKSSASNGK
jgi:hypothetical protein